MLEAVKILNQFYDKKSEEKNNYSLASFSKELNISPQALSNFLNQKRGLSKKCSIELAKKLKMNVRETEIFINSIQSKYARSPLQKRIAAEKLARKLKDPTAKELELELFQMISNWHHFAILELLKMGSLSKESVKGIAKRLPLSENEIQLSLNRLEKLGLVNKNGKNYSVNQEVLVADQGVSNEAIRRFHLSLLNSACQSLHTQNEGERYGSSSVISIKMSDLEKAKNLIRDFRLKLDKIISANETAEEVYGLTIQFFRLSEKNNTEKHKTL